MREITTITYEAFDGTVFDDFKQCKAYEEGKRMNALETILKGVVFKNPFQKTMTLEEVFRVPEDVFYFKVFNETQFKMVKKILELEDYEIRSESFEMVYCEDDCWVSCAECERMGRE